MDQVPREVRVALGLGILAWIGCVAGAILEPRQFYRAYLFSYVFWIQFPIGSMALLAVYHLTGGKWGLVTARQLRASVTTIPLLALLFVPLFAGMGSLYPWMHPGALAASHHSGHFKEVYLTQGLYWARSAFYFFCWFWIAWSLLRSKGATLRGRSGLILVLLAVTITFSSIDWVMSIDREWKSTAYGPIFMLSDALSSMSLALLTLGLFPTKLGLSRYLRAKPLNDAGNLLLVTVLGWTYLAFMQYLIVWSGNLPDEVTWYLERTHGGWKWFPALLAVFSIAIPFICLLFRAVKTHFKRLGVVAGLLLLFRVAWSFWYVIPAYHPGGFAANWLDFSAFFSIGGLWTAAYLGILFSRRFASILTEEERNASAPAISPEKAASSG